MPGVEIRPATAADAPRIAHLFLESAAYHEGLDPFLYARPEPDAVIARVRQKLAAPRSASFVALVGGEVVGFALVRLHRPAHGAMLRAALSAYLDDIGVATHLRRRGVGRALVDAAETWARTSGALSLTLDVHYSNSEAIRFYEEAAGFRPVGIVMIKRLESDEP